MCLLCPEWICITDFPIMRWITDYQQKIKLKFPLAPVGVLARRVNRKFSVHMSAAPSKGNTSQTLKSRRPDSGGYVKFTSKYIIVGGFKGANLFFW